MSVMEKIVFQNDPAFSVERSCAKITKFVKLHRLSANKNSFERPAH